MIEAITGTLFEYIDWMSQQVVAVYEDERERWLENQNSLRALRVREVLTANKPIDMDAAITSIRYPLRWHHLALVMWYPDAGAEGDELGRLQKFLRELGESAGAAGQPALRCRRSKLRMGVAAVSCRGGRCRGEGPPVRADPTEFPERGNRDDGRRRRGFSSAHTGRRRPPAASR